MKKLIKTAIITGVTGQDGAYLSKFLLKKKYKIIGLIRACGDDFSKLEYLGIKNKITFEECDLLNLSNITKIFEKYDPHEVYNFAAQSSVRLSFDQPALTIQFNIMSVINLLESIKHINSSIRFFQPSSCEMFGNVTSLPVTEKTVFQPLNPYAIAKASAHWIVKDYRKSYDLFACNGILFHHESHLRGKDFFIRKIVRQAVEIKKGKKEFLMVGNLEVKRDMGYAPAYVEAMWLMLQQRKPDDFVICSGKSVSLRDIVYHVFNKLGISREKVVIDKKLFRPVDVKETLGDNSKAKIVLGWNYEMNFYDVLDVLIKEEMHSTSYKNCMSHQEVV